jgi:hypothetical protein
MDILQQCPGAGYKLCSRKLHWYLPGNGCKECKTIARKQHYINNREEHVKRAREWNVKNKERYNENRRRWAHQNTAKLVETNRAWYNKNLKKARQLYRRKYHNWKVKNGGKLTAKRARRRAKELKAKAAWLNQEKIAAIYKEAVKKTQQTGVKHHVDHIFPLKSDWLCGLHVETNLQVLTYKENLAKGNRTWPGQLDFQKGSVYAIFSKELTDLLND